GPHRPDGAGGGRRRRGRRPLLPRRAPPGPRRPGGRGGRPGTAAPAPQGPPGVAGGPGGGPAAALGRLRTGPARRGRRQGGDGGPADAETTARPPGPPLTIRGEGFAEGFGPPGPVERGGRRAALERPPRP